MSRDALQGERGANHLYPLGLAYICEGLKEQRKGLVTLVLWNNQLTHTGMASLVMALLSPGAPFIGSLLPGPNTCFIFNFLLHLFLCLCICACTWRVEDSLQESVFSYRIYISQV